MVVNNISNSQHSSNYDIKKKIFACRRTVIITGLQKRSNVGASFLPIKYDVLNMFLTGPKNIS